MSLAAAVELVRSNPHTAPMSAWRTIASYARRCVGRSPDAEDVVQDTLIAVLHHVSTVREPGHVAGWIATVAKNKAIDRARARASRRLLHTDEFEDIAAPDLPDERARTRVAATLAALDAAIESSRAHSARRHLRPQMRSMLHRALGGGRMDVREEARLPIDLSDDAVSKWIERGREPLLELLAAIGERHRESEDAVEALSSMIAARRADAGVPRATRRRVAA